MGVPLGHCLDPFGVGVGDDPTLSALMLVTPHLSGADATPPSVALHGVATPLSRLIPQF